MTIATEKTKISYTGDNSTDTFDYGASFAWITSNTEIVPYLDDVKQTSGYTISGDDVVFTSAPATGVKIDIRREMPNSQSADYTTNDPFPAATHEKGLDHILAVAIQNARRSYVLDGSDYTSDLVAGDGKYYFHVPREIDGFILDHVHAEVITAGTTGTMDIEIYNVTDSVDMLGTTLTIDSTETGSDTAAAPHVVNSSNDDVSTNDLLRVDIDALQTTKAKGLIITLDFIPE